MSMLKLYKIINDSKSYWETWEHEGVHTVHWGTLGTQGESKEIKSTIFKKATTKIQKEIDQMVANGFRAIELEDHFTLLVEFEVDGMGCGEDVEKRYRLQDRMDETLGWTGSVIVTEEALAVEQWKSAAMLCTSRSQRRLSKMT